MFDVARPLHIVQDKWPGMDIHLFKDHYLSETGQRARTVKPADLRLIEDKSSKTGYALYCVVDEQDKPSNSVTIGDELLEPIYQVSLELIQPEYRSMTHEMLCHLATCSLNDFRSIFLVHDKRMLAVILEEIDDLVHKLKILSKEEGQMLREAIAPSFLPKSQTWEFLLSQCNTDASVKDNWVLKGTRGGLGENHVFGWVASNEEWMSHLTDAYECNSRPSGVSHVLQRRVHQVQYELRSSYTDEIEKYFLIGSYMVVNGQFLGLVPFRRGGLMSEMADEIARGAMLLVFTDLSDTSS
jgi:hypothetical protein